jgi:hypothetical protein
MIMSVSRPLLAYWGLIGHACIVEFKLGLQESVDLFQEGSVGTLRGRCLLGYPCMQHGWISSAVTRWLPQPAACLSGWLLLGKQLTLAISCVAVSPHTTVSQY